jgi:nucleoid DNA-binding protein
MENKKIKKGQLDQLIKLARDIFVSQVVDGVINEGVYKIPNFGKFKITKRHGQLFKNRFGKFNVPDTYVIRFAPTKTLKQRIKARLKMKQGGIDG